MSSIVLEKQEKHGLQRENYCMIKVREDEVVSVDG